MKPAKQLASKHYIVFFNPKEKNAEEIFIFILTVSKISTIEGDCKLEGNHLCRPRHFGD